MVQTPRRWGVGFTGSVKVDSGSGQMAFKCTKKATTAQLEDMQYLSFTKGREEGLGNHQDAENQDDQMPDGPEPRFCPFWHRMEQGIDLD